MGDQITLADGTTMDGTYVLESNRRLWFYVQNGSGIREVFTLMADPEKTARITMNGTEYTGYTSIESIRRDGTLISGGLTREE